VGIKNRKKTRSFSLSFHFSLNVCVKSENMDPFGKKNN
jgi:hypothetical protein